MFLASVGNRTPARNNLLEYLKLFIYLEYIKLMSKSCLKMFKRKFVNKSSAFSPLEIIVVLSTALALNDSMCVPLTGVTIGHVGLAFASCHFSTSSFTVYFQSLWSRRVPLGLYKKKKGYTLAEEI
jgi:hypothetical protein